LFAYLRNGSQRGVEFAEHDRVARCAFQRLVGKRHHIGHTKTRAEALEAERGHDPVGVATRAGQQIDLPLGTLNESAAQIRDQCEIGANRRGKCRL